MSQRLSNGEGSPNADHGEGEVLLDPATKAAFQPTGDHAVDDVLEQLDAVTGEPLDSQIQVGEQVHRVLQNRLADLGKE